VADCFHRVPVKPGDAMFLPSGRVHAIGSGLVIFEIQQNSDTTYRVFDWNRMGLDGRPREMHVAQSLASMDFNDFEPGLAPTVAVDGPHYSKRRLVSDPLFAVDLYETRSRDQARWKHGTMQIIGLAQGRLIVSGTKQSVELGAGQFCLVPAGMGHVELWFEAGCKFLCVEAG
jgi:mannose-6-phosphate isomerase